MITFSPMMMTSNYRDSPYDNFHAELTCLDTTEITLGLIGDGTVDWGDGTEVPFTSGSVVGTPVGTLTVIIKSDLLTLFEVGGSANNSVRIIDIKSCVDLTSMDRSFRYNQGVEEIYVRGLNKVTNWFGAFQDTANGLHTVQIDDMSHATTMSYMFDAAKVLVNFTIDTNTANVTSFMECHRENNALVTAPEYDTSGMTTGSYYRMYLYCYALETAGGIIHPTTGSMASMFYNCSALTCIGGIDTRQASNTTDLFTGCDLLTSPNSTEQTALLAGDIYTNGGTC